MPTLIRVLVLAAAGLLAVATLHAAEIHDAAAAGDVEKVKALLDADPTAVDLRTPTQKTPLHVAALAKQIAVVRLLAERKADLEAVEDYGRTPLVLATREMAGVEVVRTLLDLGANPDAVDRFGSCALELAAWRETTDVVALLLERKARIPTASRARGTLFRLSIAKGQDALFARLVEDGADPAEPSLIAATSPRRSPCTT